jgi:hypothetical protein
MVNPALVVGTVEPAAGLVMARPAGRLLETNTVEREVGFCRE